MPKNPQRIERIADLIQHALAKILQQEAQDSRFRSVTITGVSIDRDLSYAKVYVSVMQEEKTKDTIAALNRARKYFRHALAQAVELRAVPELKFIFDDTAIQGDRISILLNKAQKRMKN